MAIQKIKAQQTTAVQQVLEGEEAYVRGLRDGTPFSASWYLAQVAKGNVFALNSGVLTTPDTLNATIADGEQDLLINVPSGTAIIPVYISVAFEDTGTAQVMDVLAVASAVYDDANTSTSETANIKNMRIDNPKKSNCSAYSVVTGSGTAVETGNFVEFWRPYAGFAEDGFNGSTSWGNNALHGSSWSAAQVMVPPIIIGQGSLSIFASAQAGTGFITVMWVELPSTFFTP